MYQRNEKAFEHDLRRYWARMEQPLAKLPAWQDAPVPLFTVFSAVNARGGYTRVCSQVSLGRAAENRAVEGHPAGVVGTAHHQNLTPSGFTPFWADPPPPWPSNQHYRFVRRFSDVLTGV